MNRPANRQRSSRLGIAIVLALLIAGAASTALGLSGRTPSDLKDLLFAAPEDGNWVAIAFDGRSVTPAYYLLNVRRGKVVGGHDNCNGWSFQNDAADEKGQHMIVSTLQECPEGKQDRAYWTLINTASIKRLSDRQLQLSHASHVGLFRRCKPDREQSRCVPV